MKAIKILLPLLLFCLLFISCSNDDNVEQPSIDELREESTQVLTSGNSKVWKITKANLISNEQTIDVSTNINITDDEFVFSLEDNKIVLVWKKGYDIQTNASSVDEVLTDDYVSSLKMLVNFESDSDSVLITISSNLTIEINNDGTLTIKVVNNDGTELLFNLSEKKPEDYFTAPESGLNFTKAFTFESNSLDNFGAGMVASRREKAIFIALRENELRSNNKRAERVLKFNLANNTTSEKLFYKNDFIAKRIEIIGEKLYLIGGRNVNIYDLDLINNPISIPHGESLSRHGAAALDNDIFIVGGGVLGGNTEKNKVFKFDLSTQTLSDFATLPEPRNAAGASIVGKHIYMFGGSEEIYGNPAKKNVYKINIESPDDIETFDMNKAIDFTFVRKYHHLIYVAGTILLRDNDGNTIGREPTIGVFNTMNDSYQELTTNLSNDSGYEAIQQMCILDNRMYIIYGNEGIDNGGQFNEWDVLVSDLN